MSSSPRRRSPARRRAAWSGDRELDRRTGSSSGTSPPPEPSDVDELNFPVAKGAPATSSRASPLHRGGQPARCVAGQLDPARRSSARRGAPATRSTWASTHALLGARHPLPRSRPSARSSSPSRTTTLEPAAGRSGTSAATSPTRASASCVVSTVALAGNLVVPAACSSRSACRRCPHRRRDRARHAVELPRQQALELPTARSVARRCGRRAWRPLLAARRAPRRAPTTPVYDSSGNLIEALRPRQPTARSSPRSGDPRRSRFPKVADWLGRYPAKS